MSKISIGIRKEDENTLFERRTPLTPEDIWQILSEHSQEFEIWFQPSNQRDYKYERCFTDEQFRLAGAQLSDELTACSLILGIKEIPICDLEPGKTYAFFSHTFK